MPTIILKNGTKNYIDEKSVNEISECQAKGILSSYFIIEGKKELIKFSDIKDIKKYDNNIPAEYKNLEGLGYDGIINNSRKDALEGMIRGLKEFIKREKPKENSPSRQLLEKMENRLSVC